LVAAAALALSDFNPAQQQAKLSRVYDEAGILPATDVPRFEEYLKWIFTESDVDVRLLFVKDLGGLSIEEAAIDRMQELRIGQPAWQERGVLLLFDLTEATWHSCTSRTTRSCRRTSSGSRMVAGTWTWSLRFAIR
jgi:uncharacterized membrane protein YgcG